ncbi:MAG: TRAP transporter large permease subunit [Chloroflexi bacterium]|nr:TRAP transporter large permease subunit [Chloroflexota bacterium]
MGTDLALGASSAIVFGILILLILSGMWVGVALGAAGIIVLFFMAGQSQDLIDTVLYDGIGSFVLVAIPLFIFLGEIILHSGLSEKLYQGVSRWTAVIPGGLLHSNIIACAIFSAVCGSSVATAATIGTVAYKDQSSRGYSFMMIGGSIAGGGTLGILIPPSLNMIVYGDFVGASVAKLFAGGILPGVILSAIFMIWIAFYVRARPHLTPPQERLTWAYPWRALQAFKDVWAVFVIIAVIFIGIYGGLMTPSEAAAVSCFVALVLAAIHRKLNFNMLKGAAMASLRTAGMVLLIVLFAKVLGTGIAMIKLPAQLSEFVISLGLSRMMIWAAIVLLYLILGMFMDGLAMMLLTLPVVYPLLVMQLGFDPIWFGVVLVLLIEIGCLTPPMGLNLFVVQGVAPHEDFNKLLKGAVPFVIIELALVVVVTLVPAIITWLPEIIVPKY